MRTAKRGYRQQIRQAFADVEDEDTWILYLQLARAELEFMDGLLIEIITDRLPHFAKTHELTIAESLFVIMQDCGLDIRAVGVAERQPASSQHRLTMLTLAASVLAVLLQLC